MIAFSRRETPRSLIWPLNGSPNVPPARLGRRVARAEASLPSRLDPRLWPPRRVVRRLAHQCEHRPVPMPKKVGPHDPPGQVPILLSHPALPPVLTPAKADPRVHLDLLQLLPSLLAQPIVLTSLGADPRVRRVQGLALPNLPALRAARHWAKFGLRNRLGPWFHLPSQGILPRVSLLRRIGRVGPPGLPSSRPSPLASGPTL